MKVGVVVFPGTNCDRDTIYAFKHNNIKDTAFVSHTETALSDFDLLILPGGFSFGDYLRTGGIAVHTPIFKSLPDFIGNGGYVIGICNGFQMLVETGILKGFLFRNTSGKFISRNIHLRVERTDTVFTARYEEGEVLTMPIAHTTGNFRPAGTGFDEKNVIFRYCNKQGEITKEANPNGSYKNIAGITNDSGRIMGLMPHFERVSDPYLGIDGIPLIESVRKGIGGLS